MRATRPVFWLYALALILPTLALAQTPAPESYLVRRTAHVDDEVTGFKTNIDYVIFRDGLLISTQRSPGQTTLIRARGTSDAVRRLQQALSENRFGSERGHCAYRDVPGQGEVFVSAVTWFGRKGTSKVTKTFGFGAAFPTICSDAFARSVQAIEDFFSEAANSPGAQIDHVPTDVFGAFLAQASTP
ncbi:MAG: hypothetical protein ABJC13_14690 [Acidobacteriota bacterium]